MTMGSVRGTKIIDLSLTHLSAVEAAVAIARGARLSRDGAPQDMHAHYGTASSHENRKKKKKVKK